MAVAKTIVLMGAGKCNCRIADCDSQKFAKNLHRLNSVDCEKILGRARRRLARERQARREPERRFVEPSCGASYLGYSRIPIEPESPPIAQSGFASRAKPLQASTATGGAALGAGSFVALKAGSFLLIRSSVMPSAMKTTKKRST